jgi:NHL repeat
VSAGGAFWVWRPNCLYVELRGYLIRPKRGPGRESSFWNCAIHQREPSFIIPSYPYGGSQLIVPFPTVTTTTSSPSATTSTSTTTSTTTISVTTTSIPAQSPLNIVLPPATPQVAANLSGPLFVSTVYDSAPGFGWGPSVEALVVTRTGSLLIAVNCQILKVGPAGLVSPYAGQAGDCVSVDGPVPTSRLTHIRDLAVDSDGILYMSSYDHVIRKVSLDGSISTLAGQSSPIELPGSLADGLGSAARFNRPWGIAIDGAGNLYVADSVNSAIRRVTPQGLVSTVVSADQLKDDRGWVSSLPSGLAIRGDGTLIIGNAIGSGSLFDRVRVVSPNGQVTVLTDQTSGQFVHGLAVALDTVGNIFLANHRAVDRVSIGGQLETLAGDNQTEYYRDGPAADARFLAVNAIAIGLDGELYVADDKFVRKIAVAPPVTTTTTTVPLTTTTSTSTVPPVTTTTVPLLSGALIANLVRLPTSTSGASIYSVTLKMGGAQSGSEYEFVVPSGHVPPDPPTVPSTQRHVERAVNGVVQWRYNITNPQGSFIARVYNSGANSALSSVEVK